MENSNKKTTPAKNEKNAGTAKEKASFDQNGKGASDKYGKAGSTPNESGSDNGPGTVNAKK